MYLAHAPAGRRPVPAYGLNPPYCGSVWRMYLKRIAIYPPARSGPRKPSMDKGVTTAINARSGWMTQAVRVMSIRGYARVSCGRSEAGGRASTDGRSKNKQ